MSDLRANLIAWLQRVCSSERPPDSVVAYNVGLFETPKGFSAYLVGADSYDEEESDWACAESFTPKERYFKIPRGGFKDWKQVQAQVVAAVRIFLNSAAGKKSFLAKAQAVTVGFDDGDLVCVQRSGFETAG